MNTWKAAIAGGVFFMATALASPADRTPNENAAECPIPGSRVHWIADYCMARLSTDDEIAAGDCIGRELDVPHRDDCAAKRDYKAALCRLSIERSTRKGSVDDCVRDSTFVGSTVRNRGVGH